jgi:hypothetical protein
MLPVGGRLSRFVDVWESLTTDKAVLQTIRGGFRLEFEVIPRFQGIVAQSSENSSALLGEEVDGLLSKNAVEVVQEDQVLDGFYSTYFLVAKKDGSMRPILNLKRLNRFMEYHRFKMESLNTVIRAVQPGMYMATLDLKDAYLHVPIASSHWKYLRFAFKGTIYQWRVVPFGLTSAPRIFTRVVKPLIAVLRSRGILVHVYLDDLLILSRYPTRLRESVIQVAQLFIQAGFILNLKKSSPIPNQDQVYLGARFRTTLGIVSLPPTKQEAIRSVARLFLQVGKSLPAVLFLRLLGLMASTIAVVFRARFHMRPVQFYVKTRWKASMGLKYKILIQRSFPPMLDWWLKPESLARGVMLNPPPAAWVLTTDASNAGWGGHAALAEQGQSTLLTQGQWSQEEMVSHINVLR